MDIPYLCRTLDVSPSGLLAATFVEPLDQPNRFPLELRLPNSSESIWLWARTVRRTGRFQAMTFEKVSRRERVKLQAQLRAGARTRASSNYHPKRDLSLAGIAPAR